MMAIGLFLCMLFLSIYTALISIYVGSDNNSALGACVAMLFFYAPSFTTFLDGLTFLYATEIWPSHLRANGQSIAIAVYCVCNVAWLQSSPTAFASIGWKFYFFFIFFCAFGCLLSLFYFPDTRHKPLEEIAALFGDEDLVMVYQQDLDHSQIPMSTIEACIPGLVPSSHTNNDSEKQPQAEFSDSQEHAENVGG